MADDPRDIARQTPRLGEGGEAKKALDEFNAALDSLKDEGEALKEEITPHWDKNVQFIEGNHWDKARPTGLVTITLNQILRIVVQQAALLSDTRPVYTIKARREDLNAAAAQLEVAAQAIWGMEGHELLIPRASMDIDAFGKNFWKVVWRPDLWRGLGDVSIAHVDPAELIVDDADSLRDTTFILHRQVKPVWWAKQTFPLVAHLIVPDDSVTSYSRSKPTSTVRLPRPRNVAAQGRSAIERVVVEEWLIRDPSYEDEVPGTGQGVQNNPKYPAGRLITRIGESAKVIAQDIAYPLLDPWPGPWVEMAAPKIRGFWPVPPINQLRVLNEALNLVTSMGMDQARNFSQGIWVVDENAMRPEAIQQLRTMTTGVVTIKPGHKAERVAGPGINPGIMEYIRMLVQAMEFIAGLMDTSYGRVPRGVTAGAAIEALQSAGQALVRLRAREVERALRETGWRIVARVLQHYTDKRLMVLTGMDGRALSQIWNPDETKGKEEEILSLLHLDVQTTTEMALSKEKSYALHAALYGMGAIDRKALLDAVEYPERDNIIKRMEASEQLGILKATTGPTPRGRGTKIIEKMMR